MHKGIFFLVSSASIDLHPESLGHLVYFQVLETDRRGAMFVNLTLTSVRWEMIERSPFTLTDDDL